MYASFSQSTIQLVAYHWPSDRKLRSQFTETSTTHKAKLSNSQVTLLTTYLRGQ